MMMNYDEAFEKVIGHEGGYVNDPSDPGGETKYGISKRAYPNLNIKALTLDGAKVIYRNDYWDKSKAEQLPPEIRYAHFDTSVNAGIRTAAKILQRAGGVKDDGVIGPQTLAASSKITVSDYLFHRALHYMRITKHNPKLATFGAGWANRIQHIWNESK